MKSHWFHSVIKCNHNLIRGQQKRMTLAASGQAPAPPSCECRRGSWERLCGRRLRTWDLPVQTLAREPRQSRIPAGGKGRSAHRLPPQTCPELLEFQLCLLLTSNLLPQPHPLAFSLISWATQHPAPSTWLFCSNYPSQVDLLFAIMNLDLDKLLNSWAFTSMQNGLYSMQTLFKKATLFHLFLSLYNSQDFTLAFVPFTFSSSCSTPFPKMGLVGERRAGSPQGREEMEKTVTSLLLLRKYL